MEDPQSKIELVKYRGRETTTLLVTIDDLIVFRTQQGGAEIEFVHRDQTGKPLQGYRISLCPEDAQRLKEVST